MSSETSTLSSRTFESVNSSVVNSSKVDFAELFGGLCWGGGIHIIAPVAPTKVRLGLLSA